MAGLLHHALHWSHIAAGGFGLIVWWSQILGRKGSRLHVRMGRWFEWTGYYVGVSSLISCIWFLAHIDTWLNGPYSVQIAADVPRVLGSVPPERLRQIVDLALASLFLLTDVSTGARVVRTRRNPTDLDSKYQRWLYRSQSVASVGTIIFGCVLLVSTSMTSMLAPVGLGIYGFFDARGHLRFLANPRPTPRAYWYMHMRCMLRAGLMFHLAFFFIGGRYLLPRDWAWVFFIVPTLIGAPLGFWWIRKYKERFGELAKPARPLSTPEPGSSAA